MLELSAAHWNGNFYEIDGLFYDPQWTGYNFIITFIQ